MFKGKGLSGFPLVSKDAATGSHNSYQAYPAIAIKQEGGKYLDQ